MSYQKLLSIMEELQHYAEQGMPIIIEGKKTKSL